MVKITNYQIKRIENFHIRLRYFSKKSCDFILNKNQNKPSIEKNKNFRFSKIEFNQQLYVKTTENRQNQKKDENQKAEKSGPDFEFFQKQLWTSTPFPSFDRWNLRPSLFRDEG